MAEALLIRGGRILDPSQGLDLAADLLLSDGKIVWIAPSREKRAPKEPHRVLEAKGLALCPGFIDLHCHLREPGFEDKETIATGTEAAARGGFTAVCAMPNTEPPVDTAAVVEMVMRKAAQEGSVRVLPIGCVTRGRQGKHLAEMAELAAAGAVGFSDDGSPVADPHLMRTALGYSTLTGLPVINHCEDPSLARGGVMNEGPVASRLGLKGVPAAAEESMAARDISLTRLTRGRLHLAHISTRGTLELVRQAKAEGLPVTAEVTPHHLLLTEEWVLGRHGEGPWAAPLSLGAYDTRCKVNPPLRSRQETAALVQGLRDGVIDAIATDHAPHTAADKACTFDEAAFGISGLETALGLLMTLVHSGDLPLATLIERLTAGPARILGRHGEGLGTLKPGSAADVTLFDPDAEWAVDSKSFASKGRNTPLEGVTLKGRVMATVVGGQIVYADNAVKVSG